MIALTQQWGANGFQEHCSHMQQVYQHRANIMHTAAVRVSQMIPRAMFKLILLCDNLYTSTTGDENHHDLM